MVAAGYVNIDLVARVPALPGGDQRVSADRIWRLLGGMAANAACAAARVGPPWAVQSELITFVGDDMDSDWALAEVERLGVGIGWSVRRPGASVPRCLILVEPNGQRAIVSEPILFDDEQIARRVTAEPPGQRPCLLHVDGYRVPHALPTLHKAVSAGWRVSVDMDGMESAWRTEAGLARLAQQFHVVFANRNAVHAIWPGVLTPDDSSPGALKCCRLLQRMLAGSPLPGGAVIVTLGADGALVVPREGTAAHVAAVDVAPVDTTGAGDIFAGTFLAFWLHGMDPISAAQHASVAAGLSTKGFGAQGHLPTAAEIQEATLPAVVELH